MVSDVSLDGPARSFSEAVVSGRSLVLAPRSYRFWARIIDGVLSSTVSQALLLGASAADLHREAWFPGSLVLGVVAWLVGCSIHWYPLVVRGQSIGKFLFGIQVVHSDGSVPEFFRLVVVRELLVMAAWRLVAGAILVDALFIFDKRRRTLHDIVAGTVVVYRRRANVDSLT